MVFDSEGYDENRQALVRRGVKVECPCGRHNSAGIWGTMGTSMTLISEHSCEFYLLDPVFTRISNPRQDPELMIAPSAVVRK